LPPTILIDNALGSDTAASGAGPAAALAGTAASTSANGLVVTLDGAPDLVNVATDGTHALWVATAAGRQYSPITARDNTAKTVTVANAYTANLTGQSWGLGGRRATLDHANTRTLLAADVLAGWTVDIQETGTDYTLSANLKVPFNVSGAAGRPITVTSSSVNRPVIRTAVSGMHLFDLNNNFWWRWSHLSFRHAGATRGDAFRANGNTSTWIAFADCAFDGFLNAIFADNNTLYAIVDLFLDRCLLRNGTGDAVLNNGATHATECAFLDNAGAGIVVNAGNALSSSRCVYARNARGIYASTGGTTGALTIRGNLFHAQSLSGIEVGNAGGNTSGTQGWVEDNVLWGNGAYGIKCNAAPTVTQARRNAYGNNATGPRTANLAAGAGDVALTADPCIAAASNDFRPNAAAGGGALLKGIARTIGTLSPLSYPDLGPYQSAGGGGGGVSRSRAVNGP
jgi:hypothetical protein